MKNFDDWNLLKKILEKKKEPFVHPREVWIVALGQNVGFEQCGTGKEFSRPALVIKKFHNNAIWIVPLSKTQKRGKYYHPFTFIPGVTSAAILSQIRLIDTKRCLRKFGDAPKNDFMVIIKKISELCSADSSLFREDHE